LPPPGSDLYHYCDAYLDVEAPVGAPVFSVLGGTVAATGADWIQINSVREPVAVFYRNVVPTLAVGADVSRGETIGQVGAQMEENGGLISFSVTQLIDGDLWPVEPTSWLAARGQRIATDLAETKLWCGQGRSIKAPPDAGACTLAPVPAPFSLLPVTVTVTR
jgi:hypothetical protein